MQTGSWLSRRRRQRGAEEWARIADAVQAEGALRSSERRELREEARDARRSLTRFLHLTHRKLAASGVALEALPMPAGTDWRWRPNFMAQQLSPSGIAGPDSGQKLGDEVALWHDCPARALILRQSPNQGATDLAPYGLMLEVLGFSGSYLSLSVDLPESALKGLTAAHILRLDVGLRLERAMRVYARLNVSHGPNTEELLRELPLGAPARLDEITVEFDLAATEMNENRLGKIWLDLIFETPQMNAIELRDVTMSRHLRADF